uniref:Uncharacterized protein LOC114336621 n=1 Tax=Diabrotica virgifera virgifera TaxID=50390 RepID=A0A6P7G741_DIAVI
MLTKNENNTWEQRCREVECHLGGSRSSEAWRFIRNLRNENRNNTNLQMIDLKKWKTHYKEELQENRQEYINTSPKHYNLNGQVVELNDEFVERMIKSLKNKKACGPEGIPAELIKNGTAKLIKLITLIFNNYTNGENIPENWKTG